MAWYVCDRWAESDRRAEPALLYDDRKISWQEFRDSVNRLGNSLLDLGVKRGDRVVLRSTNCPELYYAIVGCMKIGAVPVPTSTLFRTGELQHILTESRASAAIVHAECADIFDEVTSPHLERLVIIGAAAPGQTSLEEAMQAASTNLAPADVKEIDEAFMLYTSGTTALPKGIVHAHRWLRATGEPIAGQEMQLAQGDVTLSVSEVAWMYPFGCNLMYPLYRGAAAGVHPGRFEPEKAYQYIEKYRATHFIANPTIYRRMLLVEDAPRRWDCSSLRMGLSSGETLPPAVFKTWQTRFGCEIYDSMGQSEIHIFCCTRPGVVRLASMGKPFSDAPPVSVVNEEGKEVARGEVGHLAIRGDHPGLALRYEAQEQLWTSRFVDGWYLTGDTAYIDDEGFFWFMSRSDDLIKSRGYLVSPKEVEDTLEEHPSVLETAVVGAPDAVLGQKVKAFIVLRPGHAASEALAEDIRQSVRNAIAPFKVPKEIEFVDVLPKTVTGKIVRRQLRDQGVGTSG